MTCHEVMAALAAAGISVYYPAAKQEICREPYAVVQNGGTYRYASSDRVGYSLVTVHCYVPVGRYPLLDILVGQVRTALSALSPDLRPTGRESVHIVNDRFRAHECTVEYMVQKKLGKD